MPYYLVNNDQTQNPGWHHEVHQTDCVYRPTVSVIDLGYHSDCHSALAKARQHYSDADGCYHCCNPCHSG